MGFLKNKFNLNVPRDFLCSKNVAWTLLCSMFHKQTKCNFLIRIIGHYDLTQERPAYGYSSSCPEFSIQQALLFTDESAAHRPMSSL